MVASDTARRGRGRHTDSKRDGHEASAGPASSNGGMDIGNVSHVMETCGYSMKSNQDDASDATFEHACDANEIVDMPHDLLLATPRK